MRKAIVLTILLVLMSMAPAAHAGKKAGHIDYKEFTLDNGLRVIMSEDKSAPVVVVTLFYHVGSAHEEEGRTGFAHLFEHMMFEGSENVAKREHGELVQRAGGTNNATTNEDRTYYYEVLPANRLNLALWLEADRMRSLVVTDKNFENQRSAVKEERLMRFDNQPYGAAFITSDTLAFDYAPYSHSVIGKMVDLDAAQTEDVQAFFDRYYSPNNAVLVIAGDINKGKTKKMVKEYFGDIPRGEEIEQNWGDEPPHTGERRMIIEDRNANVPAIFISYIIPPYKSPDRPAMNLLAMILTEGESSRMHQRLVKEEEVAVVVFGGLDARKGPGLFRFIAASNIGVPIGESEDLIYEEIEAIKVNGIDEKELEKAKIQFKSNFIAGRQTVLSKAQALQRYAYYHEDLNDINNALDLYMSITSDDIKRVANQYLIEKNRTVVIANPAGDEES